MSDELRTTTNNDEHGHGQKRKLSKITYGDEMSESTCDLVVVVLVLVHVLN